ncbi:M61 family metallopeptidase [Thiosocius teredinicola]|uniref:M61 family metallopeptidase n=1 Tax=Thiosocius teredinicola TaxID=1973002 RepID=UPI000990E43C
MNSDIRYDIVAMDLAAHEFVLRMEIKQPLPDKQQLTLPAWIPGSYMIRDFARNVTEISASDREGPVDLIKLDKQTWQAARCSGPLIIDYRVYAFDLSVRSAFLDQRRAYFNGTCLFICPAGRTDFAWQVHISDPSHQATSAWRVATTMPADDVDGGGFGVYAGTGYATLIDYPVEIADFDQAEFQVGSTPHQMVFSEPGRYDLDRIAEDVAPICAEHAAMFGELPVDRYLFMTLATADGYGGLEHLDSTSLICKRSDLPVPGAGKPEKGYRQFLGLCSHEYFHLWNVKRIRPAVLAATDLRSEAHTELLWAFEGITSYYDELALARCGVLSDQDYLDLFAGTVTRVLRSPGRVRQSVAESSFDAWTKFYKQDENAPNAIVSYYTKGALVAFGLDMLLRQRSADRVCLDDLMRLLWQRFGKPGIGVPERGIEPLVAELLGESVQDFFASYVYGTTPLPLGDWFAQVGVGYRERPAKGADDLGGYNQDGVDHAGKPHLGARFEGQAIGIKLIQVISGGPAQRAGLSPGDIVVAVDGEQVNSSNLSELLERIGDGEADVHFFRRGRLNQVSLRPDSAPNDTCELWLLADDMIDHTTKQRRTAWLSSNQSSN